MGVVSEITVGEPTVPAGETIVGAVGRPASVLAQLPPQSFACPQAVVHS